MAPTSTATDNTLILRQGSCGYGPLFANTSQGYNYVGLPTNHPLVSKSAQHGCGLCLEGGCNPSLASILVTVVDSCAGLCRGTDINLPRRAFQQLGQQALGRLNVTYTTSPCQPSGNIIVHVDQFRLTQGGYLRLSLKNVGGLGGFVTVALGTTGSRVSKNMTNSFGAWWELSLLPTLPYDLMVADALGNQLTIGSAITTSMLGDVPSAFQM
ncbi:MAG: hypothetical protein WDW36_003675 [Sanguina aurantia]